MIEHNSNFWNKRFVIDTILSYFFLSLSLQPGKSAPVYKVLSVDYSSALEMLNKEYENMIFDDLDLKKDLKVSFHPLLAVY